jgi:hypothetical protein
MEKFKIYSAICTPDGTILESKHVHDFKRYLDKNGEEYMIDGGLDYMRTYINKKKAMDLSIYSNEPHELVRCFVERGGRGKDGKEPLKFVLLKDIDDNWLKAIIDYEEEKRPNNKYLPIYKEELKWRKIG